MFRFRILIDSSWPDCNNCPKIIIDTPLFHPLVDPVTGEMSVQHYFPEWKKEVSRIWHVVDYVLKSFYDIPRIKTPANPEAAELYVKFILYYMFEKKKLITILILD